ncbi:predicted protein, partial [Nematostella vectensis]
MEIEQKCVSLTHFSIEHSLGLLLIVDLQGSGHTLYDPEIASRDHTKDGKFLFAAGNLSQTAMDNFLAQHREFNMYCKLLEL